MQLGFSFTLGLLRLLIDRKVISYLEAVGLISGVMGAKQASALRLSPERASKLEVMRQQAMESLEG